MDVGDQRVCCHFTKNVNPKRITGDRRYLLIERKFRLCRVSRKRRYRFFVGIRSTFVDIRLIEGLPSLRTYLYLSSRRNDLQMKLP